MFFQRLDRTHGTKMSGRPTPESRERFRHFQTIPTRWMDNDVYGHVNNVIYYSYFDTVVNQYLIERGETRRGLTLPSVEFKPSGAQPRLAAAELSRLAKVSKAEDWRRFVPESKAEPDYGGVLAPTGRAIFYDAKTTKRDVLDFDNLHVLRHLRQVEIGLRRSDEQRSNRLSDPMACVWGGSCANAVLWNDPNGLARPEEVEERNHVRG